MVNVMAGTKIGGMKAAQTNKALYGDNFYATIGSAGGKRTMDSGAKPKGFAIARSYPLDDPRHPANAGRKGGAISKRTKKKNA